MGRVMRPLKQTILAALIAFTPITTLAAEKVVVATLEWPPYTSEAMPRLGVTSSVVEDAFAAAGMDVEILVTPWKRAIAAAKNETTVAAYFPGYHCDHDTGFTASAPIGKGPLGFAEHVDAPLNWSSLEDIVGGELKIGTVLGYANTTEFDAMVGSGKIRAAKAKDDLTNLRKLARKRIDAAVIDKLVLANLLATEPSLEDAVAVIRFNDTPLEDKTLYLCFTDDEIGRALRDRFDSGLAKLNVEALVDTYFEQAFK